SDTRNDLNAMYMLKVQKTKKGIPYVAGIGAGIEDIDGKTLSNILLQADRIAMINPENGNTTPLFVAQGNQLFLNDVLMKSLIVDFASITGEIQSDGFKSGAPGWRFSRNGKLEINSSNNGG
ncbi:DUF1983 domain-containing protein, partial [Escherichia coli]|nr:DUF1983 domain-containing protein [Escherichia coli]